MPFYLYKKLLILIIFLLFSTIYCKAQEIVVPLKDNHVLREAAEKQKYLPQRLMKKAADDTLKLPFFDDFSYVGRSIDTLEPNPIEIRWKPTGVFINPRMAQSPPTVGVATFDGLNKYGLAYHQGAGNNIRGRADTLTSQIIDLSNYTNDTNVFLSFFYQPKGFGDAPEEEDSLVVEFRAQDSNWVKQWGVPGVNIPGEPDDKVYPFKQAIFQVKDTFLHGGFQFRFIGRASHTGNLDHWNVDYVYMDKGRNPGDTIFRDVAISTPPNTILKGYYAMPAKHFRRDSLKTELSVSAKNLYDQPQNVSFRYEIRKQDGSIFAPANPGQSVQTNVNPFAFETLSKNLAAEANTSGITDQPFDLKVKYSLILGGQVTAHPENDTAELTQRFSNYYAYDDGSAEAAISLIGAKFGQMALRFTTTVADTLTGIAIHFDQAQEDNRFMTFSLAVWESINGDASTVDKILGKIDDVFPDHGYGFRYYKLDNPIILEANRKFYVGWIQNREFLLNVGFDKNYSAISNGKPNPNLWYQTLLSWQKSQEVGTPMIRPVFGSQPFVGINEERAPTAKIFSSTIYPNPTNGAFQLSLQEDCAVNIFLYDFTGKMIDQQLRTGKNISLNYNNIQKGMYLLRVMEKNGNGFSSHKIIFE